MAKRKKRESFKGDLAIPIRGNSKALVRDGLLDSRTQEQLQEDRVLEQQRVFDARMRKIPVLREHYGIPEHKYWMVALLLALAEDVVPGFRVDWGDEPRRGRRRKWTSSRYTSLLGDVALLQSEEPSREDLAALRLLTKQPRFAKRWGAETPESLQKRLHEARTSSASFMARLLSAERADEPFIMELLAKYASVNAP